MNTGPGEFIVYFGHIFYVFLQNSYYRSSGHVVLECWISFGYIQFLSKLFRFIHFCRHYNFNLRFSFIPSTKFFVFPTYFDRIVTLTVHCLSRSY